MSKFIHQSVRLNTNISRAMRSFLIGSEAGKWLGEVKLIENKIGGIYHVVLTYGNETWVSKTKILEKEFDRSIKFELDLPESLETGFESSLVEISFMQGASKTEYCTEIHVLHKGLKDNEMGVKSKEFFDDFWKEKLNCLRVIFNGNWVIEDRDLVLSVLKSSF